MQTEETPRGAFNRATHLQTGETLEIPLPSYGRKVSFRNTLMELVKRRGANSCFKVTSKGNAVFITKLNDYHSSNLFNEVVRSATPEEIGLLYDTNRRTRTLQVALEEFAAGNIDEDTAKDLLSEYTEEEIQSMKEKINGIY